jgi:transcriptional regulator with XRE-family HTH domain
MGTRQRHRPDRLAEKLLQIRSALGLSQNEMISRMSVGDYVSQRTLSEFELGKREPPLRLLLQYARVANVYLEALADDELDLPAKLPSAKKSEGVRRRAGSAS